MIPRQAIARQYKSVGLADRLAFVTQLWLTARMSTFRLYYTPTSCGAASFITAHLGGLSFESETVDLRTHKTQSGADFYEINPKGNVPTLVFSDDSRLNENVATLTYLADTGNAQLAPKEGSKERYQYLNALGFVTSELHKSVGALFNPAMPAEAREPAKAYAGKKIEQFVSAMLDGGKKRYLVGDTMSAADIYAYIVLSWTAFLKIPMPAEAQAYFDNIKAHEGVQKAHAAMAALTPA